MRSRSLVLTLALVLIGGFPAHSAYAARTTADDEAEEPFQGRTVQYYRPEACKKCHEEIYNQWKSSMHAKSTALKDPIHEAMYQSTRLSSRDLPDLAMRHLTPELSGHINREAIDWSA